MLHMGLPEQMYMPAEVKTMHPKSGEVMVGGSRAMGGMAVGSENHACHLEVQMCSRKSGAVDELGLEACYPRLGHRVIVGIAS